MSERAVLAGGCFWGMQDLIRKLPGVLETRVGYTGGDVQHATYHNHGTHAEGIEITFDPNEISYRTLLEFFFQSTTPQRKTDRVMTPEPPTARLSTIFLTRRRPWRKIPSPTSTPPACGLGPW